MRAIIHAYSLPAADRWSMKSTQELPAIELAVPSTGATIDLHAVSSVKRDMASCTLSRYDQRQGTRVENSYSN